jgi:hypothetical protein
MSIFYVNSTIEIEGKIRRRDGTLFNPTGVRVTVTTPSGVSTTYVWGVDAALQQAEDSNNDPITGVFILTYTPAQVGTYTYVFESYGDYAAKVKNIFQVERA